MSRVESDDTVEEPLGPKPFPPFIGGSDDQLQIDDLTLSCPTCAADLVVDELFASHRVCGTCHRHFSLPARERLALLIDPDTFHEIRLDRSTVVSGRDERGHQSVGWVAGPSELTVIEDAVVVGSARIGGTEAVIVVLDDHLVGSTLGALVAEKVMLGFEQGLARRLPVVVLCAGGSSRVNPGPLAPVQASRLATSGAQLRLAGVPLIAVLTHPMSEAMYAAIPAHSDVVLSEPGVRLAGLAQTREASAPDGQANDEDPDNGGWIDAVVGRVRLRNQLGGLLDLLTSPGTPVAPASVPEGRVSGPATWNALTRLRHPQRPGGDEYLAGMIPSLFELRGDRLRGDDRRIIGGIGRLGSMTVMAAALMARHQDDGGDEAIAVRKLTRMARLAGRLEMPLVLLVGGSGGTEPHGESIETCQSVAGLAEALAMLPVPVVCVGLGELRDLTAQAMMSGDRTYMLENAVSATGSQRSTGIESHPGGGHWRPGIHDAGMVLTAHQCERLGLVDGVIPEPVPGAHADPAGAITMVSATVLWALADVAGTSQRRLLDTRHRRLRAIGRSTPEGLAAVMSELRELQEWQRTLSRSIEGWRERWDLRGQPFRLSIQRPDLADLAERLRARRAELLERTGRAETPEE